MKKLNYFPRHLHQITKYTEDFEEEEKLIRQALIDFPIDTAVILQLLMTNLWRQKKREESISIANMILLLVDDKQDISSIYYELGVDYNVMGQTDKAIESYNKAVEVDKEDFESIIDLTEIYLEKKEWDNLITTFNLIPDENEDFNMDKFFQQGYAYSMKKEFALAKERFEKYNEKDADNLDVKFNLGSMNAELGNYSIAIKIFSDILEIYPDKSEVYYHIGTVYCSMGDHYMAMHNFLEALKKGLISECTHIANRDVYYGSYEPDLKDKLAKGYSVIVNTDIAGTRYYKEHYDAITIFLDPGDLSSIAGRLKNRNPEITQEEIQARLQNAEREIACEMPFYEHVVKNEDGQLDQAICNVETLIFG